MEILDIVNDADEVIGQAERQEIYDNGHCHRIVHVWVFNDIGELALQKRSKHCGFRPLHWGVSAAGHVSAGEDYDTSALRELEEEIGVVRHSIEKVGKEFWNGEKTNAHICIYRCVHNGDFSIDEKEVDHVRWVSVKDVKKMIDEGEPFTRQFLHVFDKFFS